MLILNAKELRIAQFRTNRTTTHKENVQSVIRPAILY